MDGWMYYVGTPTAHRVQGKDMGALPGAPNNVWHHRFLRGQGERKRHQNVRAVERRDLKALSGHPGDPIPHPQPVE